MVVPSLAPAIAFYNDRENFQLRNALCGLLVENSVRCRTDWILENGAWHFRLRHPEGLKMQTLRRAVEKEVYWQL